MGTCFEERDIPPPLLATSKEWHDKLLALAADANESLRNKYIESGDLSPAEIKQGIRCRALVREIIPVFCGAAFRNKGIQTLLDGIVDYLPSPADVPAIKGVLDDGKEEMRLPRDDGPFAALVFKTASDPFVGSLSFFRVYSGVLHTGDMAYNPTKGKKERIGRIVQMHANAREEIDEVRCGDIAAAGLKYVSTGDTLCDKDRPLTLERMEFPEPVMTVAVEPKTMADEEKMSVALSKLAHEDPSFRVSTDNESMQTVIAGMGELHLEIVIDRMKREFSVDANMGRPRVAYRETIRKTVEKVEGKFIRQSGGRGQYGHVVLRLEPQVRGAGYEFIDEIVGGAVPREYIPAVDQGVQEQMKNGVLAGYPIDDVRVILFDGSYHDVDSNEMAFKIAASMGFKAGAMEADPVLLEPVMKVEIVTPEEYLGVINSYLNRRCRGVLQGSADLAGGKVVRAEVPLSEMFGYATELRSATQGRATYTMEFKEYREVPARIANAIRHN